MSREIDISDPSKLSEEDRLYLQQRNRLPEDADPVDARTVNNGSLPVGSKSQPVNQPAPSSGGSVEVGSYEDLTKAELVEEAESRGLDSKGSKSKLVALLESNDAEVAADNEEE